MTDRGWLMKLLVSLVLAVSLVAQVPAGPNYTVATLPTAATAVQHMYLDPQGIASRWVAQGGRSLNCQKCAGD